MKTFFSMAMIFLFIFTGSVYTQNQSDLNHQLITAVRENNTNKALSLLNKGASVNATDSSSLTALMIAVRNGYTDMVQLLIRNKADLNLTEELFGLTALHYAIHFKKNEIAIFLLESGANTEILVNEKDYLVYAIEENNPDLVRFLIKTGFNPHKVLPMYDSSGNVTLLMIAAKYENIETAEILLSAGLNIETLDGYGDPAFNWAAFYKNLDMINFFIARKCKLNVRGYAGYTALDHAVSQGAGPEIIETLKKAGCLSGKQDKK